MCSRLTVNNKDRYLILYINYSWDRLRKQVILQNKLTLESYKTDLLTKYIEKSQKNWALVESYNEKLREDKNNIEEKYFILCSFVAHFTKSMWNTGVTITQSNINGIKASTSLLTIIANEIANHIKIIATNQQ